MNLQLAAVASARCLLRLLQDSSQSAILPRDHDTFALEVVLGQWLASHAPGHEGIL